MAQWLVALSADPFSLDVLAKLFRTPDLIVYNDRDAYYLTSQDLEVLADAGSVRDRAVELVGLANWLGHLRKVYLRNDSRSASQPNAEYRSVRLADVVYRQIDELRRDVTIIVPAASAYGGAFAPTVLIDGVVVGAHEDLDPPKIDDSSTRGSVYQLAVALRNDARVREVLEWSAETEDWASCLYKAYEIVGLDVGEAELGRTTTFDDNKARIIERGWRRIVREGWAEEEQLRRFRKTANSPRAIGSSARHAVQMQPPPLAPMSEQEARRFMLGAVVPWMSWKLG